MSWWHKATVEQKLAQIDGGIECGMTSRQIGMNCGASLNVVKIFCSEHGRKLPARTGSMAASRASGKNGGAVTRIARARQFGVPNTSMTGAFYIFERENPKSLFNHHPND